MLNNKKDCKNCKMVLIKQVTLNYMLPSKCKKFYNSKLFRHKHDYF